MKKMVKCYEITNVRNISANTNNTAWIQVWNNIQIGVLLLTIAGQAIAPHEALIAQIIWLIANIIASIRNFILHRPFTDKIKDIALTLLTFAIILYSF